jgi:hypothetical protein
VDREFVIYNSRSAKLGSSRTRNLKKNSSKKERKLKKKISNTEIKPDFRKFEVVCSVVDQEWVKLENRPRPWMRVGNL